MDEEKGLVARAKWLMDNDVEDEATVQFNELLRELASLGTWVITFLFALAVTIIVYRP